MSDKLTHLSATRRVARK